MAGQNQSEQIESLTRLLVQVHLRSPGLRPKNLRFLKGARSQRQLGKLCGVTAETIDAWEKGTIEPTTAQALAWLNALHARVEGAPATDD